MATGIARSSCPGQLAVLVVMLHGWQPTGSAWLWSSGSCAGHVPPAPRVSVWAEISTNGIARLPVITVAAETAAAVEDGAKPS